MGCGGSTGDSQCSQLAVQPTVIGDGIRLHSTALWVVHGHMVTIGNHRMINSLL